MGYGARTSAEFAQFQSVIQQYNASGERFRIDSHCQSACTMFLSIRNVCVSQGATLLFHAGGSKLNGISPLRTQQMLGTYNAALQQYVSANHFMDTFDFHPIPAVTSSSALVTRPAGRDDERAMTVAVISTPAG